VRQARPDGRRLPLLAAGSVLLVAGLTGIGAAWPPLVAALQRQPSMLHGEAWRFVTALFVYSDAWWKVAAALLLFLLVAVIAERGHSRRALLAAFAAGGLAGEVAGVFWQPVGSGISVAGCGLLGLVLAGLAGDRGRSAAERLVWPAAGLAGALALCALRDIHGPPVLAGAAAGVLAQRARLDPRRQ